MVTVEFVEKMLATPPAGPRPEVTPAQTAALEEFKKHFGPQFALDGKELSDREKMWLVSSCFEC